MPTSLSAHPRRTLAAGIALGAIFLGLWTAWRHLQGPVSPSDLAQFLDARVGRGRVVFSDVRERVLSRDLNGVRLAVTARAVAREPLYTRAETAPYLRQVCPSFDEGEIGRQRQVMARAASEGALNAAADPLDAVIVQVASPSGSAFRFAGVIEADASGQARSLALASGGFEGGEPRGEARSAFVGASFAAGSSEDDARLRVLVAEFTANARRAEKVQAAADEARAQAIAERRRVFLERIAPGRVFQGSALEAGRQQGTPLYLEFVEVTPDKELTVLLRNEGGWRNPRVFHGTWDAGEDFRSPVINLTSAPGQAVSDAGPFLENTQTWTLALGMDAKGGLNERGRIYQYQFQPVLPDQVPFLKERLEGEFERAIAATEPGLLYKGAVSPAGRGGSESLLLRILSRSGDGRSIEAVLESTSHSWKRPLHGSIRSNARRSRGEPILLQSPAGDALAGAPADSILGYGADLELRLGVSDGALVGDEGPFASRFTVAGEGDLSRLEAERVVRMRRLLWVLRSGVAYDGLMREEQGFVTHARLEIARIDGKTGSISARISSLGRAEVYRDFLGNVDRSGSLVVLGATARGSFVRDGGFELPFLVGPSAATLELSLSGSSLAGRIVGNTAWTIEFPVAALLTAPTESPEPNAPAADGSVFPAFPKTDGAYLLADGAWMPMPHNGGHVAEEKPSASDSGPQLPRNLEEAVDESVKALIAERGKKKEKVAYLEFAGADARPVARAATVVVLWVGPDPDGAPALEMAPAQTRKDGQRWVDIVQAGAGKVRFGEDRVAAFVRKVGARSTLLTTTSSLPAGPYALNAGETYELTKE